MVTAKHLQELEKVRRGVARKVRELRTERRWTQDELAKQLHLSQGYLSELERGTGSFTAEQFLKILSLFNVPANHFAKGTQKHELDLQNALARLGAVHLRESADVLPSEHFEEVANVVRETLASQSPRQLTALAPVLVANVDRIHLAQLQLKLAEVGLDRRLGWLVENTVEALRTELPTVPPGPWRQPYRRAELVLGLLRDALAAKVPERGELVDLLDPTIVTKKSIEEVRASSSPISQRWGMVTSLQPQDFVDALRAARADH
jgi:transcriptional regulator with XRE-family HTH domain